MDKVSIPTSSALILLCNSLHSGLLELDGNGCVPTAAAVVFLLSSKKCCAAITRPYLISSSLAKSMTTLAFGFSLSRRMTLSNSSCLGSRGILTDWEMHTPPKHTEVYRCQCDNLEKPQKNTFTVSNKITEIKYTMN